MSVSLGKLAESIYCGFISIKSAKNKQKDIENIFKKLEEHSPKEEKYKTQKTNILLNAREFTKEGK